MKKKIRKRTQTEHETIGHAKLMRAKATEDEDQWREKRGLTTGLHWQRRTEKAGGRRKRAECPSEPKATKQYRRWRNKKLGTMGAALRVRRIDPRTGEVMQ